MNHEQTGQFVYESTNRDAFVNKLQTNALYLDNNTFASFQLSQHCPEIGPVQILIHDDEPGIIVNQQYFQSGFDYDFTHCIDPEIQDRALSFWYTQNPQEQILGTNRLVLHPTRALIIKTVMHSVVQHGMLDEYQLYKWLTLPQNSFDRILELSFIHEFANILRLDRQYNH